MMSGVRARLALRRRRSHTRRNAMKNRSMGTVRAGKIDRFRGRAQIGFVFSLNCVCDGAQAWRLDLLGDLILNKDSDIELHTKK